MLIAPPLDTRATLKEAMALKLYTDTTNYQSELRKAHWESTSKAVKSAYYHWAMTLYEAHLYHAKPISPQKDKVQKPRQVFHGLTRLFTIDRELPLYFGPFSTTVLKSVAKHFSKGQGLMFSIAPSFQNPFKFCVGINMEMLSAFKNESEFLMYNQIIPIKKTETFSDAMELLVSHLLFSLKNRKTRINDLAAFYHKLGVEWNDQWIAIILQHKLLFAETQCKPWKVIDRLFAELDIMDQRLVDCVLDMTDDDGKPYIVYLVEELKVKQLLQHYRLMTSVFTIKRYCKEIGCSWLKWEPNNIMNDELGVDVDDSCFDDAEYQINDQAASLQTYFVRDDVRTVRVRQPNFFGDRWVSVREGNKQELHRLLGFIERRLKNKMVSQDLVGADHAPHNFGDLLKVDGYSNGCIFVDDIPSSDHHFQIDQKVKFNDDSYGKINRIKGNAVCVKVSNENMSYMARLRWLDDMNDVISFRWMDVVDLTLSFQYIQNLGKYEFTIMEGQEDQSQHISSSNNYKFRSVDQFEIPCDDMLNGSTSQFIGVYIQRIDDAECKWGRLALIKYPQDDIHFHDEPFAMSVQSECASAGDLLKCLQRVSFEIIDRTKFVQKCGMDLDRRSEWMQDITAHPLLFAVTRYRRKLIIERLIVELKLWSTEWIHRILEEKMMDKPMLEWLVEDRKMTKLHDHYRIYKSLSVQSSALLKRRWLRFNMKSEMDGKPGFGGSDDSCFKRTRYEADGVPLSPSTTAVTTVVHQITITNTTLFGPKCIVLHEFENDDDDYVSEEFADALRCDGEVVFINPIPSTTYSFCVGQEVQFEDGTIGRINRTTSGAVCVKFGANNVSYFRWIERERVPMELILMFRHRKELHNYRFAVTATEQDAQHISKADAYGCHNFEKFGIPCNSLKLHEEDTLFIYATLNSVYLCEEKSRSNSAEYGWTCLKQIKYSQCARVDDSLSRFGNDFQSKVNHFVRWLRENANKVQDANGILCHFGLELSTSSEWMPLIAHHSHLFSITAYLRQSVIERLLKEFDLWSHDMIYRLIRRIKEGELLIKWLLNNLFVKRLYDVWRAFTAGFHLIHHSELLGKTWLEFEMYEKESEIIDILGVEFADDSSLDETTYILNDVVHPMNTTTRTICVTGIPQQICRNETLFGDYDINTNLMSFNNKTEPIWSVSMSVSRDHLTWYRNTVAPRQHFPLSLNVLKHNSELHPENHSRYKENTGPRNLLLHGTLREYFYESKSWIVFEKLTLDAVPTVIVILNYYEDGDDALKSMKIFGSADDEVYEEWIRIDDLLKTDKKLQCFELDSESIYFAWSRRFRYFRLCSMQSFNGYCGRFFEVRIEGISLQHEQYVDTTGSMNFVDALNLNENYEIVIRPAVEDRFENARKLEIQQDGSWINVKVSRENEDKICVKWGDGDLLSYLWIKRSDIPTKLRFDINFREQISELIFSVAIGAEQTVHSLPHTKEISFESEEEFVIPLNELTVYSNNPDTVCLYVKPQEDREEFEFEEVKRLKCGKELFTSFVINDSFFIDCRFMIKPATRGKFEVFAASDIIIQKSGTVQVSCCASERDSTSDSVILVNKEFVGDTEVKGGFICLVSGGNVLNEGNVSCSASNPKVVGGGAMYIDTDGVFENKGIIDCGEEGFVHIKCSEFKNDGLIIPDPKVTYKDIKDNQKAIEQMTETGKLEEIRLTIWDHRGHRESDEGPGNLVDRYKYKESYCSRSCLDTSNNDWIIFRNGKESRTCPMTIEIRNATSEQALKTVTIEGSADGIKFDDWIRIPYISNESEFAWDLRRDESHTSARQVFTVGPLARRFAWERAFRYFKLNVLANYGDEYNRFYEFRMTGIDEE